MAKQPDYEDAAGVFQKSMQEALANLDKVSEEARQAHEKAIDMQIAAKEELHQIQLNAETISRDFVAAHRKEIEERIKNDLHLGMVKKLIMFGIKSVDLMRVLEVSQKVIAEAWHDLGFEPLGAHIANLSYEEQGRAGNVIFYREDIVLKFWYEFGKDLTLAFIEVPKAENWVAVTALPLEDRMPILKFIGERVVRDKAEGYTHEIKEDAINIILK